jgi:Carboxypeptidase regulatory-like domain/TonB-dependent Receptor Plug Domain
MENVRCSWVRAFVVVMLCIAAAPNATAQGTGTLTGTVADETGATLPGATVTATDATTATVRSVVSNEAGIFRIAALNPGRYVVKVELSGFKPVTIADINLLSLENRDLGKVSLALGGVQENLTVTADVTPVQVSDSSRMKTITLEDLTNIQVKGRDMYAMLNLLPGVQDTNLNRDFATWTSASAITINGAPTINKDLRVDGMNIVDEGGCSTGFVNLNMDAIGQIQVLTNGYTAENGRNNGGLISVVTKSGTSQLKGSGWYNGRRDRFNANDYFRKASGLPKPLYRINITGYGIGGPIVIPGIIDSRSASKKLFFFGSQEYTDDARPTTTSRANMPTALEKMGDFSQTRITNGTIQPIIDPRTGLPFPGNVIPANRISPLGQKMLNLLPTANGVLNPQPGQEWTSNSAYDLTPLHSRTNHVFRVDQVWSEKTRWSARLIKDRDDNWSWNRITPGTGFVNQNTPGILASGGVTQILKPTVVNEMTFGYTHNRWGFKAADDFDYRSLYAETLGINAPRIEPYGSYSDPPKLSGFGGPQVDEWPYAPRFSTTGGNRANLGNYRVANGTIQSADEPIPRLNMSARASFADSLSMTKGRHNIKMGLYVEWNKKTEPGSADYMGNFNFGHDVNNPLSTGNGYANMLLGIYTTYTELTARIDRDTRHWQSDAYVQDNWRATSRLTIDYGLRLQHSGSEFEVNNMNSGFFADQWKANQAARVYKLVCMDSRPGDQPCPATLQRTIDPAFPSVFLPSAFNGNIVSGTGNQINGIVTGGIPGEKPGTYFHFPYFVLAPRVGFAWNVNGDGKTAIRGSAGIFYNFPRSTGTTGYTNFASANCPIACSNQIRWATFDDIATAAAAGNQFVQNPVNVYQGGFEQPLGKSFNVNIAYQKDVGFNTVAEVAYVGNFGREPGRFVDVNRLPLNVYGNPVNLVNNSPLNANSIRTVYGQYPGMGSVMAFVPDLYAESLRYNGLQLNVVRRLSAGLQMGMAYTLSKAEGYNPSTNFGEGYDPYTDEIGGENAIKARYWGPTPEDRRHNLAVNYSYNIPGFATNGLLKYLTSDWQVSGVTRLLSGQAVTPSCVSNNAGIQNSNPSLTDGFYNTQRLLTARCELTGEPIFSGYTVDPNLPYADQPHFNVAAFRMPSPNGSKGNFGNSPVGILRNPTWHEWDVTVSRRFAVGARKNAGVKLQLQAYNVFNEVQFTTLNATYTFTGPNNSINNNANTGKYVATGGSNLAAGTIQPRTLGLTVRFDW